MFLSNCQTLLPTQPPVRARDPGGDEVPGSGTHVVDREVRGQEHSVEDRAETEGTTLSSGLSAPSVGVDTAGLAVCAQAEPNGQLNFGWERTGFERQLVFEVADMQPVWKAVLCVCDPREAGRDPEGFKGLCPPCTKAP